jgi:hypothetical protein
MSAYAVETNSEVEVFVEYNVSVDTDVDSPICVKWTEG